VSSTGQEDERRRPGPVIDLEQVAGLARDGGTVLIATVCTEGEPHLAVGGEMEIRAGKLLAITAWFCPLTVGNVAANANLAVVVWSPARDEGYQVVGDVLEVEEVAVLDGYALAAEIPAVTQAQRRFLVRAERVLRFTRRPHSDQPL